MQQGDPCNTANGDLNLKRDVFFQTGATSSYPENKIWSDNFWALPNLGGRAACSPQSSLVLADLWPVVLPNPPAGRTERMDAVCPWSSQVLPRRCPRMTTEPLPAGPPW